jgi:tetratricopeptide (TPR) repeat protein
VLEGRIRKPHDRSDLLLTKARLAETEGLLDKAMEAYVAAQAAVPADPLATYSQADLLIRQGHYAVALERLADADRIAAEGYPRIATARAIYTGLGQVKRSRSLPAADVYLQAITRFPDSAFFHIRAAEALVAEGRGDEATGVLRRLGDERLPIEPDDRAAYEQLTANLQ